MSARKALLLMAHDNPATGGHLGREATIRALEQQVWWPTLRKDVRKWCNTCKQCRITKAQIKLLTAELRTTTVPLYFHGFYGTS